MDLPLSHAATGQYTANYTFHRAADIRVLDGELLWAKVYGEDGNEIELTIINLTYGVLADYMRKNKPEE